MSKLVTKGNLAIFEYPGGGTDHEFTLEEKGVLWIFGYLLPLGDKVVSVCKRFDTGLNNYKVVGKYTDAKFQIKGDFNELLHGLDEHRCLVMIRGDMGNPITEEMEILRSDVKLIKR